LGEWLFESVQDLDEEPFRRPVGVDGK
jgi:hypothetical protein